MRLVPGERAAICDLFEATGPDAPTVLPGWRAGELLAHLLVRERQPLAAPGILVPALARFAESAMDTYKKVPWPDRDEALWSALRLAARLMYRHSPVGVRLRHATRARGAEINARSGPRQVTVVGTPGELVLHGFGRELAQVDLDGAPADIEALQATSRGI